MAAFTSKASGNWSTAGQTTWNEAGAPGAGDSATIQDGHNVTVDQAGQAVLGVTVDSGGTVTLSGSNVLDIGAGALVVNGTLTGTGAVTCEDDVVLGSGADVSGIGSIEIDGTGSPMIACNGEALPLLIINTTGTVSDDGNDITCSDGVTFSAGVLSSISNWVVTGGSITGMNTNRIFEKLTVPLGSTLTRSGTVYARAVANAGTIDGVGVLIVYRPVLDGWWVGSTGEITGAGVYYYLAADIGKTPGADLAFSANMNFWQNIGGARGLTMDANISCGALTVKSTSASASMALDMNGHNLSCTGVVLGDTGGTDRDGVLTLGPGHHVIGAGGIAGGAGAGAATVLNFDTCYMELDPSGTINGANIGDFGCTGATVVNGTIDNVDLTGEAALPHYWPAAAGTGNADVSESGPHLGKVYSHAYATA